MIGRIVECNGTQIIQTIAGATAGTVCKPVYTGNTAYALAITPNEGGEGYVGIGCNASLTKPVPTYNPLTGVLSVECIDGQSGSAEGADTVLANATNLDQNYNLAFWGSTAADCYCPMSFSSGRAITYNPYTATLVSCNIGTTTLETATLCVDSIQANGPNIVIGSNNYTSFSASGSLYMSGENNITGVNVLQTNQLQFNNCGTLPANWNGAPLINVGNEVYEMPGVTVCDECISMPDTSICMCDLDACCGYFENQLTVGNSAAAINDVGEASFSCSVQSKRYYAAADCVSATNVRVIYFEGYNCVTGQATACGAYIGCYGQAAEFGFRGANGTYYPIRVTQAGTVHTPTSLIYAGGLKVMLEDSFNTFLINCGVCCITRSGNTLVICQRS